MPGPSAPIPIVGNIMGMWNEEGTFTKPMRKLNRLLNPKRTHETIEGILRGSSHSHNTVKNLICCHLCCTVQKMPNIWTM